MLTETARLVADTFLRDFLLNSQRERRRLSNLLGGEDDDVASRLRDAHLPFVEHPFRGRPRQNCTRAMLELHWRCAIELANFDDAALARLHNAFFSHEELPGTTLEVMQRILPHYSQLAEFVEESEEEPSPSSPTVDGNGTERQQQPPEKKESLAASYEKWSRFDDADDDLDELWCSRHNRHHRGECPKCVQVNTQKTAIPSEENMDDIASLMREAEEAVSIPGCFDPEAFPQLDDLARRCRVARRRHPDDENLRKATEELEKRLDTDRRQLDVVKQLQTNIENMPDDQVSFDECFRRLRTAEAHMPSAYKASFAQATRQHQNASLTPSSPPDS